MIDRKTLCAERRARKAFRSFENRRKAFYIECGASEDLCDELLAMDRDAFRSLIRDIRHRADMNPNWEVIDMSQRDYEGDEWMDDIDSEDLFEALAALKRDELEILGDYVIRGSTQREIARRRKLTQSAISRRLKRIFSKIRKALPERNGASEGADDADEEETNENTAGTNVCGEDEKGDREE